MTHHRIRFYAATSGSLPRRVLLFMAMGLLVLTWPPAVFAQGAGGRVENLSGGQEGQESVLTYDLVGEGPGIQDVVIMEISLDNGKTWHVPKGLSGDVGKEIRSGKRKRIRWNMLEEFPQGMDADVRFRVQTASERDGRGSSGQIKTFTVNGVSFKMVRIPAGEFMMGSPSNEPDRDSDEGPQHRVRISRDFWLGQTEVTQGLWKAVMGSNPSDFKNCGDDCPVEKVSWNDCQEFIRKLNGMVSGGNFRLPTEAEWEYSCRAGTTGPYAGDLDAMGWYGNNSGNRRIDALAIWNGDASKYVERMLDNGCRTHPAGKKQPNAWGLYDMHGNVWEWCQDWKGDYPSGAVTDTSGPSSGSERVLRGGSWGGNANECRSALRVGFVPGERGKLGGFRLAGL